MKALYQLIILGTSERFYNVIVERLYKHLEELGVERKFFIVINPDNFDFKYARNAPAFCLYFGDRLGSFQNLDLLEKVMNAEDLIIPVVEDLQYFIESTPEILRKINGFELSQQSQVEGLVNLILEGLSLLRISRRLFISYRRAESSLVAMQLYEQLEKRGFDVFLDTHSVRPGEPFQEELWHRLADSDIVLLLNTPGFLTSEWTQEELAKANAMQIGILQLLWPAHKMENTSALSIPFELKVTDFGNAKYSDMHSYLNEQVIEQIAEAAESLRARSLAARHDNLTAEFMAAASKVGKAATLQPQRFIKIVKKTGEEIIVIPTVGVPEAFGYNMSDERIKALKLQAKTEVYLLYDHINIRDNWLKHIDWLDGHLPIKSQKVIDALTWLTNL